jgi:phosphoribosylglycinamide formyltransferase 1
MPELPRIAVLVSGRGSNLAALIAAIQAGTLRALIALVISSKPDVPALQIAADAGILTVVVAPKEYPSRRAEGDAIVSATRAAGVEMLVLAGYGRVFDPVVVQAYPWRIVNIHPSLLPAFAGSMAPGPQAAALAAGVKISGCTTHFVTADIDAGPIIAQAAVVVRDDDTVESLADRILQAEHELLPRTVAAVLANRVQVVGTRTVWRDTEAADARG